MVNEINNNMRIMQINERCVQNIKKIESPEKVSTLDDKLDLSAQVQQLNQMDNSPMTVPVEHLNKIKNAILSGNYLIDHAKIADVLLNRNSQTI